jgi:hypothetical protein
MWGLGIWERNAQFTICRCYETKKADPRAGFFLILRPNQLGLIKTSHLAKVTLNVKSVA